GTISCVFLFGVLPVYMGWMEPNQILEIPLWMIFVVCSVGSAILEYTTSYVLERLFHAVWWDYSDMPLNLNGRICLPASFGFGIAGILVTRFVVPFVLNHSGMTPPNLSQFLALLFMFIFGGDMALTVASLTSLIEKMEGAQEIFDEKMEDNFQVLAAKLNFRDRYHIRNMLVFRGRGKHNNKQVDPGYYKRFRSWMSNHEFEFRKKK
nr:putative ABC transporter permease [Lachnospiraceae bacterium]